MMQRTLLLVAVALTLGTAWALDPLEPPPPAGGESDKITASPAPAAADAEPAAGEDGETLPPLPPGASATGPTPQRFDPSEEVRADFPVSFPVDI